MTTTKQSIDGSQTKAASSFIECSVYTKHALSSSYIYMFNLRYNLIMQEILLSFYRWCYWGTEKSTKVIEIESDEGGFKP